MSAVAQNLPPPHLAPQPSNGHQNPGMDQASNADAKRPLSPYPPIPNVNANTAAGQNAPHGSSQPTPASGPAASLMQLRQEIPPAPPLRGTRKRKSPPSAATDGQQAPPPPQPQQLAHPNFPPAGPMPHPPGPMHHYQYPMGAELMGGPMAPQHMQPPPHPGPVPQQPDPQSPSDRGGNARQLSSSKRAEQNRKAQRAFRERRDQHVKALESRSQLLDAALASADEANRRWEECRALVDQLRIENASLRASLQSIQMAGAQNMNLDDGKLGGMKGTQSTAHSRQPSVGVGEAKES